MKTSVVLRLMVVAVLLGACGEPSEDEDAAKKQAFTTPASLISNGWSDVDLRPWDTALNDSVELCVLAEGFDGYRQPLDNGTASTESPVSSNEASVWGLGISTKFFASDFVGPELLGAEDGSGDDPNIPPQQDDNEAYVESLDRSAREKLAEVVDRCELQALEMLPPFSAGLIAGDETAYRDLAQAQNEYENAAIVVAERQRVRQCMTQAGFEHARVAEVEIYVEDRLQQEVLEIPFVEDEQGLSRLDPAAEDALANIQTEEIALAVALGECGGLADQLPEELKILAEEIADDLATQ
jgi:hypothetical protein